LIVEIGIVVLISSNHELAWAVAIIVIIKLA